MSSRRRTSAAAASAKIKSWTKESDEDDSSSSEEETVRPKKPAPPKRQRTSYSLAQLKKIAFALDAEGRQKLREFLSEAEAKPASLPPPTVSAALSASPEHADGADSEDESDGDAE
eukprot:TRINITY_DN2479_c0_g1_i1.p3 TRINITY_DN2479_c0_g1~~TRINITY_DN2479_c0_g1_i1.p3  ORF type:complete len:129 (+),score=23.93 TRINITY_DN2479_c0_g1_i1:42-389(+)